MGGTRIGRRTACIAETVTVWRGGRAGKEGRVEKYKYCLPGAGNRNFSPKLVRTLQLGVVLTRDYDKAVAVGPDPYQTHRVSQNEARNSKKRWT